jgi:methylenetetrahydrofolate dehydrogenase (NADP+) / methenyltetrahydrofolate cyclohydrolase
VTGRSAQTPRTPGGAVLMDGVRLRDEVLAALRDELVAAGRPPVRLATVVAGDDAPSRTYVGYKHAAAARVGIAVAGVDLGGTASQAQLEDAVGRLASDPDVHGVFVQLPLPAHVDEHAVTELVPPAKDVDGLTERNLGRLVVRDEGRGAPGHVPCTALAILRLLERFGRPAAGRRVVIVGRSALVGRPLALLLGSRGVDATVTVAHSATPNLQALCLQADILVAAEGRPRMITTDHVAPGATVVDAGATRTPDGLVGDVDFERVQAVAGAITPNPGGVGPMTVACLLANTVAAARMLGALPATAAATGPSPI